MIVGDWQVMIRVRGSLELTLLLATQSERAAQSCDAVTASHKALCRQLGVP